MNPKKSIIEEAIDLDDIEWGYYDPKKEVDEDSLRLIDKNYGGTFSVDKVKLLKLCQYIVEKETVTMSEVCDKVKDLWNLHKRYGEFGAVKRLIAAMNECGLYDVKLVDDLQEAKQLTPDDFDIEIFDIPKYIKSWMGDLILYQSVTANSIKELVEEAIHNNIDLQYAYLRKIDLQGADLCGANLYGADLQGTNLRGVNLRRANLLYGDLKGADLRGADLANINLIGATLYNAKFSISEIELRDIAFSIRDASMDDSTQFSMPLHEAKEIDLDDIEWGYYDPKKEVTMEDAKKIHAHYKLIRGDVFTFNMENFLKLCQYILEKQTITESDIYNKIKILWSLDYYPGPREDTESYAEREADVTYLIKAINECGYDVKLIKNINEAKEIDLDDIEWGYYEEPKELSEEDARIINQACNIQWNSSKGQLLKLCQYIVEKETVTMSEVCDKVKDLWNLHKRYNNYSEVENLISAMNKCGYDVKLIDDLLREAKAIVNNSNKPNKLLKEYIEADEMKEFLTAITEYVDFEIVGSIAESFERVQTKINGLLKIYFTKSLNDMAKDELFQNPDMAIGQTITSKKNISKPIPIRLKIRSHINANNEYGKASYIELAGKNTTRHENLNISRQALPIVSKIYQKDLDVSPETLKADFIVKNKHLKGLTKFLDPKYQEESTYTFVYINLNFKLTIGSFLNILKKYVPANETDNIMHVSIADQTKILPMISLAIQRSIRKYWKKHSIPKLISSISHELTHVIQNARMSSNVRKNKYKNKEYKYHKLKYAKNRMELYYSRQHEINAYALQTSLAFNRKGIGLQDIRNKSYIELYKVLTDYGPSTAGGWASYYTTSISMPQKSKNRFWKEVVHHLSKLDKPENKKVVKEAKIDLDDIEWGYL